jgi:hypothetical protein
MRSSWIIALVLLGWRAGAQTTPPAAPATSAPSPYVGSEVCQTCHEDIYNAFQKNPHKLVDTQKRRGWEAKACEGFVAKINFALFHDC